MANDITKEDDSELVQTIAELYSLYTGQEIADAHAIIRKRLNLIQEVKEVKKRIKRDTEQLAELETDDE